MEVGLLFNVQFGEGVVVQEKKEEKETKVRCKERKRNCEEKKRRSRENPGNDREGLYPEDQLALRLDTYQRDQHLHDLGFALLIKSDRFYMVTYVPRLLD